MFHDEYMNFKENTKHGDALLPFVKYYTAIPDILTSFPMHWHDEIELIYIHEGKLKLNIDLESVLAEEGDLVVIKPCSLHSFSQYEDYPMKATSLLFNMDMIKSVTVDTCSAKYLIPFNDGKFTCPKYIRAGMDGYTEIMDSFNNLVKIYKNKGEFFELRLKSELFNFIYYLFKYQCEKKSVQSSYKEEATKNIKIVLDYIRENYDKVIEISELSALVNFSSHYFMRFFKENMGVTCVEYMNDYRLNVATSLLTKTNMSINGVAEKVGVPNVSYFNRMFKKKYNMTPREYKKYQNINN